MTSSCAGVAFYRPSICRTSSLLLSWFSALGIQLRQSASDGQRKVVGISLGCGQITRLRGPRTAVLPRPPQHIQVPVLNGPGTGPLVPRAVLLPRPLQHIRVPAHSAVLPGGCCHSLPQCCIPQCCIPQFDPPMLHPPSIAIRTPAVRRNVRQSPIFHLSPASRMIGFSVHKIRSKSKSSHGHGSFVCLTSFALYETGAVMIEAAAC